MSNEAKSHPTPSSQPEQGYLNEPLNRKLIWTTVIIIAIAVLLRAFLAFVTQPALNGDEEAYDLIARNILSGLGFKENDWYAYRYPGYCYLLALTYMPMGPSRTIMVLLQLAASAATMWLLFTLARRYFGNIAGFAALIIYSFYIPFLQLPGRLYTENLAIPFFLLFWLLYLELKQKPSFKLILLSGLTLGLGALNRESSLSLGLPLLLFSGLGAIFRKNYKLVGAFVLIVVIAAAVISPWTIRNYLLFHKFVPLTTNAPINIYMGAQPNATGLQTFPGAPAPHCYVQVFPPGKYVNNPAEGKFEEIDKGNAAMKEAVSYIKQNPLAWGKVGLKKIYYLWTVPSVVLFNVKSLQTQIGEKVWDIQYLIVLILGLFGVAVSLRFRNMLMPHLILIMPTVVAFCTTVVSRFRFPFEVGLIFFSSLAVTMIVKRYKK